MAQSHRGRQASDRGRQVDPLWAGILFVAVVATAVCLIGIIRGETSPYLVMLPTALAAWSIYSLRR